VVDGYESLCPENIWFEVICRCGRRYLLCHSAGFVYAYDPETLDVLEVFKER